MKVVLCVAMCLVCVAMCSCKSKTTEQLLKEEMTTYLKSSDMEESIEGDFVETDTSATYTVIATDGLMYEAAYNSKTKSVTINCLGVSPDTTPFDSNFTENQVLEVLIENGYAEESLYTSTLSNHTDNVDVWEVTTRDNVLLYIDMNNRTVTVQD